MLELKAGAFVEASSKLVSTASYIEGVSTSPPGEVGVFHEDKKLEDLDRGFLRARLTDISKHMDVLGADVTRATIADADAAIGRPWATWGHGKKALEEVRNTLKRELSLKTVLVLQSQEALYYAPKAPLFGQDFADKFKTAGLFELDEAAKCFAVGRPTACVFHLMRIMEIGIRAFAACLKIPDPVKPAQRNWGNILRDVKSGLDQRWPNASDRMAGDGLLFEALYASLDAVKNPWRNETMHPAAKYTDDEAKHVFVAVEGFMKKLSARMDENGEPKA